MQLKSMDITYCVKKIEQTINSVESLRDKYEGFVNETKDMLKEKKSQENEEPLPKRVKKDKKTRK